MLFRGTVYKNLPPENIFVLVVESLECHAPLDPMSLFGKMEGKAAEQQLCVYIMTEAKEAPSELQGQLKPLGIVHVKRFLLCYGPFASFTLLI